MSDAIVEKTERDPFEEFKAQMKALKEKLQSPLRHVPIESASSEPRARAYAESYPEPPGKLSAKVERLENEIVELKNTIAAQNAVIQQLEQRLARLEAV